MTKCPESIAFERRERESKDLDVCRQEKGHPGKHTGRWLNWDDRARGITVPVCASIRGEDKCRLPLAHKGWHESGDDRWDMWPWNCGERSEALKGLKACLYREREPKLVIPPTRWTTDDAEEFRKRMTRGMITPANIEDITEVSMKKIRDESLNLTEHGATIRVTLETGHGTLYEMERSAVLPGEVQQDIESIKGLFKAASDALRYEAGER